MEYLSVGFLREQNKWLAKIAEENFKTKAAYIRDLVIRDAKEKGVTFEKEKND